MWDCLQRVKMEHFSRNFCSNCKCLPTSENPSSSQCHSQEIASSASALLEAPLRGAARTKEIMNAADPSWAGNPNSTLHTG